MQHNHTGGGESSEWEVGKPGTLCLGYSNRLLFTSMESRWVKQLMGIKEGACQDAHRVMYGGVEPLDCTPETNITLYAD